MRRLKNVAAEMTLHVLTNNMTRVINLIGMPALIAAMEAKAVSAVEKSATEPLQSSWITQNGLQGYSETRK